MDTYTKETRAWLEERWDRLKNGRYDSHQPIYGLRDASGFSGSAIWSYCVTYSILKIINSLDFGTCVDIGTGEGYIADKVAALKTSSKVFVSDLALSAVKKAGQLFNLRGVVLNAHKLPFKDEAFDLVIATEVIEHLMDPQETLKELLRIAKKFLLITTPLANNERERRDYFRQQDPKEPHRHLWFFTKDELGKRLGRDSYLFTTNFLFFNPLRAFLSPDFAIKKGAARRHGPILVGLARFSKWITGAIKRIFGIAFCLKVVIFLDFLFCRLFDKNAGMLVALKKKNNAQFNYKDLFNFKGSNALLNQILLPNH